MKNNIQGLVAFCVIALGIALFPAKGEASSVWTTVGTAGFSAGAPVFTSLAFNPSTNEPYVAYKDETDGDKATVMKFDGTSWVTVGTAGFSAGEARGISFAFNPSTNEPYVAYRDMANGGKETVMKFDGTSWVAVGAAGFSADFAYETSLAFNPATNEPYVIFADAANAGKATVMKFGGTSWVTVGTAGFSSGNSDYNSLAFNPSTNEPYVAYNDGGIADKATVMKFDGTSWTTVGIAGFSTSYTNGISLAFNPSTNEPYVAYSDVANLSKATVMKFDGTSWVTVGTAGFSGDDVSGELPFSFNPATNEPYVAYRDDSNGSKATVMKFDGTSWVTVGTAGFSEASVSSVSLAFNPATNEPYVSYRDGNYAKVTVVKFPLEAISLTASPAGAKYSSKKSVALSASVSGAAIYYTLDGTTPTASSTLYTGTILISKSKTLKAIAIKSGYADSSVMSESYTIKKSSSHKKKKKKISSKIISKAGERIAPYITLITPRVGSATVNSFVIQGAASDKSGIQSMFVSVNGTKKKKSTTGSISYTAKKLMNASINVSAYDTLGNVKVAVVTITNGRVSGVRYY